MQTEPEVSIIIINYNTFDLTVSCIQSVIEHTTSVSFEIILVDNHSTDQDAGEIEAIFPGVRLLRNETNTGFARAANQGIAVSRGKFILLLNSDTELKENSVLICLATLKEQKDTAVISCNLLYPDGRIQLQCQRFPTFWPSFLEATRLFKLLPVRLRESILQGFHFSHNRSFCPDWVWGTFFFFRREALRDLPAEKLSERFFMYCEDMEWCYLFREAGWNVCFTPATRIIHHVGGSGSDGRIQKSRKIIANEKIFIQTYFGKMHWMLVRLTRMLNYSFTKRQNPLHHELFRIYKET
ncbi:MAG TPA: glycosyltransferase family 2 protein [Bacteroidia bacterium]|nr:glycosyltransferase family 2 protein [Bacteroidia bacterium]